MFRHIHNNVLFWIKLFFIICYFFLVWKICIIFCVRIHFIFIANSFYFIINNLSLFLSPIHPSFEWSAMSPSYYNSNLNKNANKQMNNYHPYRAQCNSLTHFQLKKKKIEIIIIQIIMVVIMEFKIKLFLFQFKARANSYLLYPCFIL